MNNNLLLLSTLLLLSFWSCLVAKTNRTKSEMNMSFFLFLLFLLVIHRVLNSSSQYVPKPPCCAFFIPFTWFFSIFFFCSFIFVLFNRTVMKSSEIWNKSNMGKKDSFRSTVRPQLFSYISLCCPTKPLSLLHMHSHKI